MAHEYVSWAHPRSLYLARAHTHTLYTARTNATRARTHARANREGLGRERSAGGDDRGEPALYHRPGRGQARSDDRPANNGLGRRRHRRADYSQHTKLVLTYQQSVPPVPQCALERLGRGSAARDGSGACFSGATTPVGMVTADSTRLCAGHRAAAAGFATRSQRRSCAPVGVWIYGTNAVLIGSMASPEARAVTLGSRIEDWGS